VFVTLFACSNVPPDRGRSVVDALLAERGFGAADATISPLSDGALELSEAILLALANNPDLAAEYAGLGFSVADIDAAGRIGNPRVSLAYLFADPSGDRNEKGFDLVQSFTALILMPSRKRLAQAEFERLQLRVAGSGQQLAYEVGVAWYDRVVARERAQEQGRMA